MIRFRQMLIVAIIFLLCSVSVMKNAAVAACDEPLSQAMESTGANFEQASFHSWVKLSNKQLDNAQLESIVQQVMGQLGIDSQDYQLIYQQQKQQVSVKAEVTNKDSHVMVMAKAIPSQITKSELEGYLIVNIEQKVEKNFQEREMRTQILHIIENFGSIPQISTCLIGWLDGKLMDGECRETLTRAFMVIDATIIDQLDAGNFSSYTGFTPNVTDWLQVGDKKINLNIAIRYSQYDNRTYVTIASPIITQEY